MILLQVGKFELFQEVSWNFVGNSWNFSVLVPVEIPGPAEKAIPVDPFLQLLNFKLLQTITRLIIVGFFEMPLMECIGGIWF